MEMSFSRASFPARRLLWRMAFLSFLAMTSDAPGLRSMISGGSFIISRNMWVSRIPFALYTATGRSAELAGIGDITGTITPGKCADMIVTEGNPLEDLRYLRRVRMVVARGNIIRDPKVKINETVRAELDKFIN